jgi:DNA-binding CsgD family transcriptional regulator
VGRVGEREAIDRALRAIERDRSARVIEVVGEPGIGKTTLLGTINGTAGERLVLTGRAAAFEGDLPFGVFVDALDSHLASRDRVVTLLGEQRVSELAAVFPSLEALVEKPITVLENDRFRMHRAVRSLLERLARARPVVLILDDLHWADPASCELIASLLRRPPEAAVLLALAYRAGRAPAVLGAALACVVPELPLERLELGRLTETESVQLIGARVRSPAAHQVLYRESGGNPFFLEQLARAAVSSDGLVARRAEAALADEVPPAVAAALAAEVGSLSGGVQAVVQAAAVAGEPFEPDVVAAIAGVGQGDVLIALDELLERDLIRATTVPRRFRFRHPLVHHAVYGSINGGWRLAAHARAARVLAARGAGPMLCAPHVEQSATVGDEHAIELLAAAAAAAAGRAPVSSARWFEAALRLVPEQGALSDRRRELLPLLADALAAAGRLEHSRATWLQALAQTSSGHAAARVGMIVACAETENMLGRNEQARSRLLAARKHHLPGTREAVLIELELARYASYMNDPEMTGDSARRALEGAKALNDVVLQAAAATLLSDSQLNRGDTAAAHSAYVEAVRLLCAQDETQIAARLSTVFTLAQTEWFLCGCTHGEARCAEGIALSHASGRNHLLIDLMAERSVLLSFLGRLSDALTLGEDCLDAAHVTGHPLGLVWAQLVRCLALTGIGELPEAVSAGEQAVAAARAVNTSQPACAAAWLCGSALVEVGQPERAVDLMLDVLGGSELPRWFLTGRPLCYEVLVRAELALGHQSEAEGWARRAAKIAAQVQLPITDAAAERAGAEVLLAEGDAGGAAVLAERSAGHAEIVGARIEGARARLLAGRAHAAAGNRERAGEQLRRAEAEFAACGALRWRAQAVRELRHIGRRVHRNARRAASTADGIDALSGREREVADLVCEHRTNREIAGKLFLSEKTVESHLRNIFVKLDVASRADVARALRPPT